MEGVLKLLNLVTRVFSLAWGRQGKDPGNEVEKYPNRPRNSLRKQQQPCSPVTTMCWVNKAPFVGCTYLTTAQIRH